MKLGFSIGRMYSEKWNGIDVVKSGNILVSNEEPSAKWLVGCQRPTVAFNVSHTIYRKYQEKFQNSRFQETV